MLLEILWFVLVLLLWYLAILDYKSYRVDFVSLYITLILLNTFYFVKFQGLVPDIIFYILYSLLFVFFLYDVIALFLKKPLFEFSSDIIAISDLLLMVLTISWFFLIAFFSNYYFMFLIIMVISFIMFLVLNKMVDIRNFIISNCKGIPLEEIPDYLSERITSKNLSIFDVLFKSSLDKECLEYNNLRKNKNIKIIKSSLKPAMLLLFPFLLSIIIMILFFI